MDGIHRGLIRHCPVCDGFEIINKTVGVIGEGKSGLKEALFLRNYTPYITLMSLNKDMVWKKTELKQLKAAGINLINEKVFRIKLSSKSAKMIFSNHQEVIFDCLYSALGCIKNNKLAQDVQCKQKKGFLMVNKDFQTSVKGLYAAGDIVSGLSQICVAESQAAIAATAIHNRLLIK
jgi:thioredoxin reductase (NADPH)